MNATLNLMLNKLVFVQKQVHSQTSVLRLVWCTTWILLDLVQQDRRFCAWYLHLKQV